MKIKTICNLFSVVYLLTCSFYICAQEQDSNINTQTSDALKQNIDPEYIDPAQTPTPIPCPKNWTVQPNASLENSLSYVHENNDLAVNVTYIADRVGEKVSAQNYARVAAQKLSCQMPVHSNLIKDAWSFYCDDTNIEAIVYGSDGNLVLLSIAGRNTDTEIALEDFIRFLQYEALQEDPSK